ncbi:MAG: phosphoenolpyruvate carboxylase [Candidatus Caenarcaniphilales bacterium]|nr:phosphoenolpyruvate carboxylase [Candidatus Caenarcaniphilales bacterium]
MQKSEAQQKNFRELVTRKYQIFNGLFLDLPFDQLEDTGASLFFFVKRCEEGLEAGLNPFQITEQFLDEVAHGKDFIRKVNYLFQILQFVERQVVLFDALEDAAFTEVNDLQGPGTLNYLESLVKSNGDYERQNLSDKLKDYQVRVVLTAHPTQFYPQSVLGIIHDLGEAIRANDLNQIHDLLLQMGKTSFRNRQKPTPLDEAKALIWYLEKIFYLTVPKIHQRLEDCTGERCSLLEIGFWPGGDRDGNPFVNAQITRETARLLKGSILNLYRKEIEVLKRRLTFEGVIEKLSAIESKLKADLVCDAGEHTEYENSNQLLEELEEVLSILKSSHQNLFHELLDQFIYRVRAFGFHFATLDLRQDSRIHGQVIKEIFPDYDLEADELIRLEFLSRLLDRRSGDLKPLEDIGKFSTLTQETLASLKAAAEIQSDNGQSGLHRYVISNTRGAFNLVEVMLLCSLAGVSADDLDIVPLFETIDDLKDAPQIMARLYEHPLYKIHLKSRRQVQTIMVGFSDGTKDGGYLMANWAIYRAKEELSKVSTQNKIKVLFFDGRGGPPSRGGGNTHLFYKSLSPEIQLSEIHLTIQGQTISSKFGTVDSARFNLEQLLTAGLEKRMRPNEVMLSTKQRLLIEKLAESALDAYLDLRYDSLFLPYLEKITPLNYYNELNIGSRPAKRKASRELVFEDLRAIPFVGAWTQMKQNVPGFYGLGSALKASEDNLEELRELYTHSLFFRTLLGNASQSLLKSRFALTSYLKDDPEFGRFWEKIYHEAKLTEEMIKTISGQESLMTDAPVIRESIRLRERIVLPLLIIQHYAMQARRLDEYYTEEQIQVFDKLILKSLAANINASRNSV